MKVFVVTIQLKTSGGNLSTSMVRMFDGKEAADSFANQLRMDVTNTIRTGKVARPIERPDGMEWQIQPGDTVQTLLQAMGVESFGVSVHELETTGSIIQPASGLVRPH